MSKTNATKTNATINFESLFNELNECNTKHELVDTMNKFGLRTTTQPTDTLNKNDLYIQFIDKSRLLITSKSLKLYTSEKIATDNFSDLIFDSVSDGSYRTKRVTLSKTLDNFTTILNYFLTDKLNYLPTK